MTSRTSAQSAPAPGGQVWVADPDQEEVVRHRGGTLLVLGAPGTGKSTAVVRAVQDRVVRDGLSPDRCLLLGPTRAAAARLRTAVGRGLGSTYTEPLARTPSSLAFAVLRLAASGSGGPLPRLLSGAEQDVILRELLAGHLLDGSGPDWPAHVRAALPTAGFRGQLRDLLMRAVEHGLEPGDLRRLADQHERPEWAAAADVLAEYDEVTALSDPGSYDPAWICTAAADVLEEQPDLLEAVRGRLDLIALDDAQELTASADRLVRVLHAPGTDLLLAGDPDTTVLGFRGALAARFITLAADLSGPGGSRQVVLGTRHGGSAALVEVTARVADRIGAVAGVAHRRPRVVPRLGGSQPWCADAERTDATSTDATCTDATCTHATCTDATCTDATDRQAAACDPVEVRVARSGPQESAAIAHWLRRAHLEEGVPWREMAVITRSGSRQDLLRRALVAGGVPVRVDRAGTPLGHDPAVVPLLTAFDVVTREPSGWRASPAETVDLLTGPLGGVDPVHLRRLRRRVRATELAAGGGRAADDVLADLLADVELRLSPPADLHPDLAPVVRLGGVLDAGHAAAAGESPGTAEDVLWALWQASGLARRWQDQVAVGGALGARADRDLDAVLVLFGAAETFVERLPGHGARGFLDHVRSAEVAADTLVVGARVGEAVEVLTPHVAAGRQWRRVVVAGVQDGVWPDLRLRDSLLGAEALVSVVRGQVMAGTEGLRAAQAQVRADELRQFLVAVSRAQERLLVTAVASTDEQPSNLLDLVDPDHRGRPPVEPPPPMTLRGLVGTARRRAVVAQRDRDLTARDTAVDLLLALAAADVPGADPDRWWDVRERSTDDDLVPSGPVRVSPSRVQTYLDCGLRWFLTSRGADTGEAVAAEIGTLVHDVIADQPEADVAALRADLERRWPELGLQEGWVGEKQREAAHRMLERYAEHVRQSASQGRTLAGTELDLAVRVPAGPQEGRDVELVGRVDRLERDGEGRLVVLDLKTSRGKPTQQEIEQHAQLGAYQVAVEEGAFQQQTGSSTSGGAALLNLGIRERQVEQRQPALDTADDPGWARRMLLEAGAGMAGSTFTAHDLGQRCRRCPARFCCPLQPEGAGR